MPAPVCKNVSTVFTLTSQFTPVNKYLGDASKTDWVYDGTILEYDDLIILAMPKNSAGTVISATHYLWYGKVDLKLKTLHLGGVITAFILFSDVQDEVDFENVGVDLYKFQTNYYFQGVITLNHSTNITTDQNTFDEYHTLSLDWTEDSIKWIVNDQVGRTLKKSDTWNESLQSFEFPQTPSRVQISLWPGGASKDAGTVAWAGGAINWDAPDIQDPGYYYAFIDSANITCYDPPAGVQIEGSKSYVYTNKNGNQSDVMVTDNSTVLASFQATGLNRTAKSDPKKNNTNNVIPSGVSSGGQVAADSPDPDNGQADSGEDDSGSTYTGAGFVQFASSTDASATSSKSGGVINIDFERLGFFVAAGVTVVGLFALS